MVTAKPRQHPHVFVPDPDLRPHPADLEKRSVCAVCHCLGVPGDARHAMPDAPQDVQRLAAGERSE